MAAASCQGARHAGAWRLFPRLPAVVAAYHVGYGLGTWQGLWALARGRQASAAQPRLTR